MKLKILYLFPHHLNIYGDRGNILTLAYRARRRDIDVEITEINSRRNRIPPDANLIFGGGGQDKQQEYVSTELMFFKKEIEELIYEKKAPALLICGTYQLFGHYFKTEQGREIPGISIFDMITVSSHVRKTGNVVVKVAPALNLSLNQKYSDLLVGFENHWGNTFLNQKSKCKNQNDNVKIKNNFSNGTVKQCSNAQPLGYVIKGYGNNGNDKTEGAIVANCLGTYLHGPLLPKNPRLADWLISVAVSHGQPLPLIDDALELQTRKKVIKSFL